MHILLVTIDYPPEIRSVAEMAKELAHDLVARGHRVTVLTTYPRYNLPSCVNPGQFIEDMQEGGVRVLRVKTLPLHKSSYVVRGLAQVSLPFLFLRTIKRVSKKFDAVIVYSPPLSLADVGARVKRKDRAKFLLNVQDVFPQNAIDLGILRNKFLIHYFEHLEARAYRDADAVTTCTEGARQFLISHKAVAPDKVTAVYNWVDLEPYETAKSGAFRRLFGIDGKFVIVFAGILGPSQGLDYVVEVARELTDLRDMIFLFLGDGTEKQKLETTVSKYNLTNVQFGDFVSAQEYPALLKEMDVGLVALKFNCKTPTIPGKFFGFAASKLPVLAFLNPESEGHRVIREAQCGYALVPSDPREGANLVRRMWEERDRLEELGKNGYAYVRTHFAREISTGKIEKILMGKSREHD